MSCATRKKSWWCGRYCCGEPDAVSRDCLRQSRHFIIMHDTKACRSQHNIMRIQSRRNEHSKGAAAETCTRRFCGCILNKLQIGIVDAYKNNTKIVLWYTGGVLGLLRPEGHVFVWTATISTFVCVECAPDREGRAGSLFGSSVEYEYTVACCRLTHFNRVM